MGGELTYSQMIDTVTNDVVKTIWEHPAFKDDGVCLRDIKEIMRMVQGKFEAIRMKTQPYKNITVQTIDGKTLFEAVRSTDDNESWKKAGKSPLAI